MHVYTHACARVCTQVSTHVHLQIGAPPSSLCTHGGAQCLNVSLSSVGRSSVGLRSVGLSSVGRSSVGLSSVDRSSGGLSSIGLSSVGVLTSGSRPVGHLRVHVCACGRACAHAGERAAGRARMRASHVDDDNADGARDGVAEVLEPGQQRIPAQHYLGRRDLGQHYLGTTLLRSACLLTS